MAAPPWIKSDLFMDLEQNGEADFVKELIDTFLADAALRIAGMRHAASVADITALASCSHALKGSALQMNAVLLAELSARIEGYARLQQNVDYPSLIDGLELALAEVGQILTSFELSLNPNLAA